MFKKKLAFLLGIMLLLSVCGYGICRTAGSKNIEQASGDVRIVTSFYPMYVLTQNLTKNAEGITVSNLTENQTGCLHNYQLTAKDMRLLSTADIFVVNGAGMELFLEKVYEQEKNLMMITATEKITDFLEGSGHTHDHAEEAGEEDRTADREIEENGAHADDAPEHDVHAHTQNGHVWMNVSRYREQAAYVAEELTKHLPQQKETLYSAWQIYDEKLAVLETEVIELRKETRGSYVVIFHDAFAYLAESLDMDVLAALALDEETVPSAGEIAEVIEEIRYHGGTAYIWIEEEYRAHADKIAAETDAVVLTLNPLVSGAGGVDDYLDEMQNNLKKIRESL